MSSGHGETIHVASPLEGQVRAAEEEFFTRWTRGPTRLRWSKLPPQIGDPAPDLELRDSSGTSVRLRDLWTDRPALLLFWRHYGCGCGLDRAKRLQEEHPQYVAAGANVGIIGQGEPERTRAYAEKYKIPCALLCDPELRAYEAYGLLEGPPILFLYDAPGELRRREPDATRGFIAERRQAARPLVDNPWQLPGEFVVDRTGAIRLAYRYQYCEDFPNPLVLLAAIQEAAAGSKQTL